MIARSLSDDFGMRIYGPNGTRAVAGGASAKRASSGTFSLDAGQSTQAAAQSSAPRTIGGIDALMALQGFEDLPERRRRAVKRGRVALDALDALKIGLLSGSLDTAALARLQASIHGLKDCSGDPGLDGVLAEIALRVEVEVAKFSAADHDHQA